MRVTQFTFYNNFLVNQQNTLNELTKVQTQLATGKNIDTIYDDPAIYTKFLKLDIEKNSLTQVKSSATFAKTFADNTDSTLNDFVSTLDSFKTKLLQAANDTNNSITREAIVKDLEGMLKHLKDLSNTSIDGKYLFSGTKFNVPPIGDDYTFQGNGEYVKAFLGKGVQREYNLPGKELFLGRDSDYQKHLTLNVPQYDKMKQHPEFVVRGADGKLYIDKSNPKADSQTEGVDEFITTSSQIRMLTGVEDIDNGDGTYSDGTSYFYLKGRTPDGKTIDTKFSLSNSDSVSDLLKKIGEAFGNSAVSKVVDVSLNDHGEIQIKSLKDNNLITDFFLVASDKDRTSVEDLVKNGDYIVYFQKSNFRTAPSIDTIKANNSYFDNRIFKFGANFYNFSQNRDALGADRVVDVLGSSAYRDSDKTIQAIDHLTLSGTDTNGNSVSVDLSIDSTTTMDDILNTIKANFGDVDAKIENGEIVVTDNTITQIESSNLLLSITAYDINGNSLDAFTPKDEVVFDKAFLDKQGNSLIGNISNVVKDLKIYYKDGQRLIKQNDNAQQFVTKDTAIMDSMGSDTTPQEIELKFRDINGDLKRAVVTLRDEADADGHYSNFWIDLNNDGVRDSNEVFDIYSSNGDKTPAHDKITTQTYQDPVTCELCQKETLNKGVSFQQLGDIVSMLVSGNIPASNSFEDYQNALNSAKEVVDSSVDSKGRFYVRDLSNSTTKIDLSMSNSNINFQANNALTVDSPEIDFFDTLQKAIESVQNGINYPDANVSARDTGIQGAIEAIDHLVDHVRREHSKIGAISNEFEMSIERSDALIINIESLQSENLDIDIGKASMELNSLTLSYQSLLASISKVNNLTLLNYLK